MVACEKCWGDAYNRMLANPSKSQSEHYHDLLEERKDNPCNQGGQPEMTREEKLRPNKCFCGAEMVYVTALNGTMHNLKCCNPAHSIVITASKEELKEILEFINNTRPSERKPNEKAEYSYKQLESALSEASKVTYHQYASIYDRRAAWLLGHLKSLARHAGIKIDGGNE